MAPKPVKIRGGSLTVTGASGGPVFQLFGRDWMLTNGGADVGNVPLQSGCPGFPGCPPGAYSAGATFAGEMGLGSGHATIGAKKFVKLYYTGEVDFAAKVKLTSAMAPEAVTAVPFELTGMLQGYKKNPAIGDPGLAVFDWKVSGKGRAVISMTSKLVAGTRMFTFVAVTYHFLR